MAAMDFNLAALKLFSCELRSAKQQKQNGWNLFGIHFQRAWLQGVLISDADEQGGRFLLDDGTGVVELTIPPSLSPSLWKRGMYVMVVGPFTSSTGAAFPSLVVQKMVDLSAHPHREPLWYLEVVEAHNSFYLK